MQLSSITSKPISSLTDDEIEYLLSKARRLTGKIPGAMNLFDIPGAGFGYATHVEREQIRRRLLKENPDYDPAALHFDIEKERVKIHRNDPPFSVYQKVLTKIVKAPTIAFTAEELEHIMEHFANANDPFVIGIAEKARLQLERLK